MSSNNALPFLIEQVLDINGVQYRKNKNEIVVECPICGKKKLGFNLNKQVGKCMVCDLGYNAIKFHQLKNSFKTGKEAYIDVMQKLRLGDDYKPVKKVKAPPPEKPLAPLPVRHTVYSKMLETLTLEKDHEKNLRKRGMTNIQSYKTADLGNKRFRSRVLSELTKSKLSFDGIPGFFKDENGQWDMQSVGRGILIPYIDRNAKIQGFQIRKDRVLEAGTKYIWYSSSNLKEGCTDGTGARTFIHYACDFKDSQPVIENNTLFLTEGAMKAEIAHQISGKPFIAIPGVTCIDMLKKEFSFLKQIGVEKIMIAYDMDRVSNLNVLQSLHKLQAEIKKGGFHCALIVWSNEYVRFDKTHAFIDPQSQFVVSAKKLKNELLKRHKSLLERIKDQGFKHVLFAFKSSADAKENAELYKSFKEEAAEYGIDVEPVFWDLHLKGIDDYLAYTKLGIGKERR